MDIDIIRWTGAALRYLDQTRLPLETAVEETTDYRVVIDAVKKLKIRGAPLIGIAAGYGMLLAAQEFVKLGTEPFYQNMRLAMDEFAASRPTAVNLFWALGRVRETLDRKLPAVDATAALEALALEIHEDDVRRCDAIGRHGTDIIPQDAAVLTHCNAGALATGGIGTAIGVLTTAHRQGKNIHVYADETRPLLQGARLTMWELTRLGIPSTLLTDNMAALAMKERRISVVVTGADRIAANGDTANKIGTYGVAILAAYHGIPFYIAAPKSTIDLSISDGTGIPIEMRGAEEVVAFSGTRTAPEGAEAFTPAFDVTPSSLIAGIITEDGICRQPYTESLAALFR